ncbi:MAG TPA: C1 family peptidase [Gammaproteobacteria bacterium]|nr:C1 family peptidase [Gammaproteobacteria bacterium]
MTKNKFGLIVKKDIKPSDDFFGGVSRSAGLEIQNESGQWLDWLPVGEKQSTPFFDTFSCVSYSALNCIEILQKYIWGIDNNYSDRALAKMSGTTQDRGNYMSVVADTIRNVGLIDEKSWPMFGKNWTEYMAEIPPDVAKETNYFLEKYQVKYEFVQSKNIIEALKFAPLQVMVYAWSKPIDGIYQDFKGKGRNHAVTLIGYKKNLYWIIFDHYDNFIKKLAWDYEFGGTIKYSIELKNNINIMIRNNTLVQKITGAGSGSFGLYLDGKIFTGKSDEVLATFIMRNDGNIIGKCKAIVGEEWAKYKIVNMKGEAI